MELDAKDRKLIALLRDDARLPISSLAYHLDVSRATVQNRINRLMERGVIQGFSVRLKNDAHTQAIRAITMISTKSRKTPDVLKALHRLPEVHAIHTTNGRWDIIAEVSTENLEEFDQILSRIEDLDGVASSETSLLLTSHKL